jgi:hypothetical protein
MDRTSDTGVPRPGRVQPVRGTEPRSEDVRITLVAEERPYVDVVSKRRHDSSPPLESLVPPPGRVVPSSRGRSEDDDVLPRRSDALDDAHEPSEEFLGRRPEAVGPRRDDNGTCLGGGSQAPLEPVRGALQAFSDIGRGRHLPGETPLEGGSDADGEGVTHHEVGWPWSASPADEPHPEEEHTAASRPGHPPLHSFLRLVMR